MAKEDKNFSLLFVVKIPQDSLMMTLKILASIGVGAAAFTEITLRHLN